MIADLEEAPSWRALLVEAAAAACVYLLSTFALLQPLLSDPAGSMPDPRPMFEGLPAIAAFKDGFLLAWTYAWGWHAIATDPLSFYDANAFYPYPQSLALSVHALGKVVSAGPVFGLTGNPVLAYELDLAACFALSGAALFLYLRHAGLGLGAALLAGAVFTFSPARLGIYFHTHLLGWMYLPIALVLLDRTLTRGGLAAAFGVAVLVLLQCLCSYYLAYLTLIAIGVYGLTFAWMRRRDVRVRGVVASLVAVGIAVVVLLLVSGPYFENRATGILPSWNDAARVDFARAHSTRVSEYLSPLGKAYLGWLPLLVAAFAVFDATRSSEARRRAWIVAAAAVALFGGVLSLGPDATVFGVRVPLPFGLLGGIVPGFSTMRAPDRFQLLSAFGVALLFGFGADALMRRFSPRSGLTAGLVALSILLWIGFEYRWLSREFASVSVPAAPQELPVHAQLAALPPGPVAEFPFHGSMGLDATRAMLRSAVHWHPLVNGKSGYEPRGREHVRGLAERVASEPGAFERFVDVTGTRYVVLDLDRLPPKALEGWQRVEGIRWVLDSSRMRLGIVDDLLPRDGVEIARACASPTGFEDACAELERRTTARGGDPPGRSESGHGDSSVLDARTKLALQDLARRAER